MKKNSTLFSLLFTVVGAIFIAVAIGIVSSNQKFFKTAIKTQGLVIDLIERVSKDSDGDENITYSPMVRFTAINGQEIETKTDISTNPPSHQIGDSIEIFYNPTKPQQIKIDSFMGKWFAPLIFGILGLITCLIGVFSLVSAKKQKKAISWLQTNGQQIITTFQEVKYITNYSVNDSHPWRIVSQWQNPNDQQLYLFESQDLWFDPTSHITNQQITVLVDPNNLKKYYMDISFLPQVA